MTAKYATRVSTLEEIGVDRTGQLADAARDPAILRLENLDTDLRPIQSAINATKNALDLNQSNSYLPFYGSIILRKQVVNHVHRLTGYVYDPEHNCVITAGGLNGITALLLALIDPGDLVITLDPIYIGLLNRVRLAGGRLGFLQLQPFPQGWSLDVDQLQRFSNEKVKAILLMSPSMPAGAVLSEANWRAIANFCDEHDAWLVYDAAMERILYDAVPFVHPLTVANLGRRTVISGSVSKECCMIGWRVGWVLGQKEVIDRVRRVTISDTVAAVGIAQQGAVAALAESSVSLPSYISEWDRRRRLMMREMEGLPFVRPHGGWSLLLNTAELGIKADAAAQRLFEISKVASTPMRGWGSPRSEDFLRFVFSNEPVERLRGLRAKIERALE